MFIHEGGAERLFSESNDKDNMYQEATGLGTVMM